MKTTSEISKTVARPAKIQTSQAALKPSIQYVSSTKTGELHFVAHRFWIYPASFTCKTMQGLHRCAIGKGTSKQLPQAGAKKAYRNALECVLAQFAVAPDEARVLMFKQVLDYVEEHGHSFDGLESLFLTGLNTAGATKHNALVNRGIGLWTKYGAPKAIGGGAKNCHLLDASTDTMYFIDHAGLTRLAPGGKNEKLFEKHSGDMTRQIEGSGIFNPGEAQDYDSCVRTSKSVGALVGGCFGAVAGMVVTKNPWAAGGAALSGASAGRSLGEEMGQDWCSHERPAGSATGGEGAGPGGLGPEGGPGPDEGPDSGGGTSGRDELNYTPSDSGGSSQDDSSSSVDSSDDSGGDDGDDDAGMPDPDDPDGFPSPEDPRGIPVISMTYPDGAGVKGLVVKSGSGWSMQNLPQLDAQGRLQSYGYLATTPPAQNAIQVAIQVSVEKFAAAVKANTKVDAGGMAERAQGYSGGG